MRSFLSLILIALSAGVVVAEPPNVILIVADDQAWTDFGFMGHKEVRTPHLDKLAAQSAVFPNGYVPTSLCRASLATLLTGQYAFQHRICCNDPPTGIDRTLMHAFIKAAPALPRLLAALGFISFQTGKFWEGHYANAGFTAGMTTSPAKGGRHGDAGLVIGRQTMKPIYDFIDKRDKKPFFVWYAPMMPHEPHNPPERLLKKYTQKDRHLKLARYYAMIEWMDETVGDLLAYLDKNKLSDNTLILFTVDNGWITELGDKKTTRGWFAPRSKMSPYEGGVRVPVVIRWPGKTKAGRYDDLVSTIDIVPTILAACGGKQPKDMPGLSLLDVAAGKGKLKREAVFGELYEHTARDINKPAVNLTHRWVRLGGWKFILSVQGKAELYDLSRDPHEMRDLAEKDADRVKQMRQLLDGWWAGR